MSHKPGWHGLLLLTMVGVLSVSSVAAADPVEGAADAPAALEEAARRGDAEAAYQFARRLEADGRAREAVAYMSRAAHRGHALAAYTLSGYLSDGKHGPVDLESAYMWLALAVENGQAIARPSLDALSRRMTRPQLSKAQLRVSDSLRQHERETSNSPAYDEHGVPAQMPRSVHWRLIAAENGDAELQFQTAINFYNGYQNFSKNRETALKWYRLAAENGSVAAQSVYGRMLLDQKDLPGGLKWLRAAAGQGDLTTQSFLSVVLSNGQYDIPRNYQESLRWLKLAANQNDSRCQKFLGERYEKGQGTPQDLDLAWQWYERAAENGSEDIAYRLAQEYEKGGRLAKNEVVAYGWYKVSDFMGYPCAKAALDALTSRLTSEQQLRGERQWSEWRKRHPKARATVRYGINCP